MLQWKLKLSALLVLAVLVATAAVNGFSVFASCNITW